MFKQSFKYYKSKNPPPNLDNVLDLNKSNDLTEVIFYLIHWYVSTKQRL